MRLAKFFYFSFLTFHFSLYLCTRNLKKIGIGLGYGVMVAQDILVVLVLVRTRVAQPKKKRWFLIEPALLFFVHVKKILPHVENIILTRTRKLVR